MKAWLTAAEIARAGLPGMPASARKVAARLAGALRTAPPDLVRRRGGRGGGYEYHIDLLPAEARCAWVARRAGGIEIPASIAREAASEPAAERLTGPATEARDARLALLALAEKFAAASGMLRVCADRHFCDLYNAGAQLRDPAANAIEAAPWIRAQVKSLAPRTLARWRRLRREGALTRLAVDRAAARRGSGTLDRANNGEVKTYILALIAKQPQLTAHHIRALVSDRFEGQFRLGINGAARAVPVPPVRTFQYALKAWREEYRNELLSIRDPDGFKSRVRFAAHVAEPARRPNELWQIDASPADVLLIEGDGVARYSLYACIDVYSRRLAGLVTRTPRSHAVGLLLRKAILAWGVPERIQTDRGADFVSRETQRLMAALGVEWDPVPPFSPEKKGHVERAIGTIQHGLMRTLPGFAGHSVADRKVIEARKSFAARLGEAPEDTFEVQLTAAELQARIDEWCERVYATAPHAGLKGQSPFAVAAMAAGGVRRIADERALDMLLAPVAGKDGLRTVTKRGIRVDGAYYIGGFLDVGETVLVRMDPADMGRAYVFAADGARFLGVAIAPEILGVDPAAAIAAARAEQKRLLDEATAAARKTARGIKAKDFAGAIVREAAGRAGKLVEFPRRAEAHDTPALAAAREAAAPPAAPSFSDDVLVRHASLVAEASQAAPGRREGGDASAGRVKKLREEETPHHRWRRACDLEAALARGETVSAEDLLWLGGYREGPEYRALRRTYGGAEISDRSQRRTS